MDANRLRALGYTIKETDEQVGVLGSRLTRRGARRLRSQHPPIHPGVRYVIVRRGGLRWGRWQVVAYQNRAVRSH